MQKSELVGLFAESRAGHDKGRTYVIFHDEVISGGASEYVYVVDGKLRTIENPKRKNIKHLIITKNMTEYQVALELREKLLNNIPVSNEEIKFVIRAMSREKGSGF